jgi:plasmid stabilization system protein ParE
MPYIKIQWSLNAIHGLQRVCKFLSEHDIESAKKAAKAIRQGTAILRKYPNAGRPAHDLNTEHQELLIPFGSSGYSILYEIDDSGIIVLAVKHQRELEY